MPGVDVDTVHSKHTEHFADNTCACRFHTYMESRKKYNQRNKKESTYMYYQVKDKNLPNVSKMALISFDAIVFGLTPMSIMFHAA